MTIRFRPFLGILLLSLACASNATFSIAACDADSGRCGVAVATHNLAVGYGAPFAVFRVGSGISQFETNPCHAPAILASLRDGANAAQALVAALEADDQCNDGQGVSQRQIGVVSFSGSAAAHTGSDAAGYAGHRSDDMVSVQGNGLVSDVVLESMWHTFHETRGGLGERLLTALEAGYAAGGQRIGVMSAALLVATDHGWPVDLDMRVDFAPDTALADLRTIFDANFARQLLFRARRTSSKQQAADWVAEALRRAPTWDRIWLHAARMAQQQGDMKLATERACHFKTLNTAWAAMLKDEFAFDRCRELVK